MSLVRSVNGLYLFNVLLSDNEALPTERALSLPVGNGLLGLRQSSPESVALAMGCGAGNVGGACVTCTG